MDAVIGQKKEQGQKFLENGKRIPVTYIDVAGSRVISVRTPDKDGVFAVRVSFGKRKRANKAIMGSVKASGQDFAPLAIREIRLADDSSTPNVGDFIKPTEILKPGDIVAVSGVSKGKGFAGVVKRHGFHGGPKTHGQSDRHRAPGSIGQGTTPGRVLRGKRMAGRMGADNVTVRNLEVVDVSDDQVLIKGLVPGAKKTLIVIK
ncbi:MAG: 50S ribosomal protein L3, partial [Candidatus Levybacteria bacterium]|nr:50S ribosomal protein L3 [Candidatus Levybacteria bacterium]